MKKVVTMQNWKELIFNNKDVDNTRTNAVVSNVKNSKSNISIETANLEISALLL